ncbi:MAG: TolB family protein [Vicinamibacterales bacterium]
MLSLGRALSLSLLVTAASDTAPPRLVLRQGLVHSPVPGDAGAISGDGRFVAVASLARLVNADVNDVHDIYVLDRKDHTLTLETVTPDGTPSDGSSAHPDLSDDGQYLVFDSSATNLAHVEDRNGKRDVFLRDRLTGTTTRLGTGTGGLEGNGSSEGPTISGDGRIVAFVSSATNLVDGDDANGVLSDVYLVRVATGLTTRASVDANGRQFDKGFAPSLSGDGRFVAFTAIPHAGSDRRRPSAGWSSGASVHVRDTVSGTITCISSTGKHRADAFAPQISDDGLVVFFTVQNRSDPQRTDIAVHDRALSVTTVITRHANARSGAPRPSADGRLVVFESWASDLLCARRCSEEDLDANLLPDVYLFDRGAGRFSRLSGARQGWWAPSRAPSIDARGETVVFSSRQPFGPEDVTVDFDLYVCGPACQ